MSVHELFSHEYSQARHCETKVVLKCATQSTISRVRTEQNPIKDCDFGNDWEVKLYLPLSLWNPLFRTPNLRPTVDSDMRIILFSIATSYVAGISVFRRSLTCGLALNAMDCDELPWQGGKYCCDYEELQPWDRFVFCDYSTGKIVEGTCHGGAQCIDDKHGLALCETSVGS